MDGDRLRVHSQYNTDGRLFIKFIALIIYMGIFKTMKDKKLLEKYTVKELFLELKKLKIIQIGNNEAFLSELSKRQKNIFKAFDIKENITFFMVINFFIQFRFLNIASTIKCGATLINILSVN